MSKCSLVFVLCVCVCKDTVWKITSTTGHLIRDAALAVDLSSTFFVRWAAVQRALHEDQLVADDDECDICTLDYVDTCQGNSVTLSDRFCI